MFPGLGGTGPGGPPSRIRIPPQGGPAGVSPLGGPADSQAQDGAQQNPEDLIQQAKDLIDKAIPLDPDHEDKLLLEKIATEMQQYLANQQKLGDTALGAGPGAKMVRKATARQQGTGGGY